MLLEAFGWRIAVFRLAPPREPGTMGRPRHQPTDGQRNIVRKMRRAGRSKMEIAEAIGVSEPTLRVHYFAELEVPDEAG